MVTFRQCVLFDRKLDLFSEDSLQFHGAQSKKKNQSECRTIFLTHYQDFVGDRYFACDEIEIFTLI